LLRKDIIFFSCLLVSHKFVVIMDNPEESSGSSGNMKKNRAESREVWTRQLD
jgi:hypothetical protein